MACKGLCASRYGAISSPKGGGPYVRYAGGFKRCQTCGIWLKWDGHRCPCCSRVLRVRARRKVAC